MQFTKAEGYGILGVIYLAQHEENKVVPLSEISEAKQVPEKFLAKIFQSLSKSGIISSHRGVRGGFSLAKKADELSIKEILESIQGPYNLAKCTNDITNCGKTDFCSLRELLVIAEIELVKVFMKYTLADLIKWEREKAVSIFK